MSETTKDVPIFGAMPDDKDSRGNPRPVTREALVRIADEMMARIQDGRPPAVLPRNTPNPDEDAPYPEPLGHVEAVRVQGDLLLADVVWNDNSVDQIPIRRWFTPELWTVPKTGQQWIDPVVAHASREEVQPGLPWIEEQIKEHP